ncbi:hypothetical protein PCASD_10237 [Puccinia coronata f. sp. avenae]|uniref:Sld7 C-terminal domain-containing protein n=2 Tax=Puccinia coronata f. sp. avenae TaxID=200324 RepID=A0A2N5UCY8_9BASI|nr:hypothetical protein PCASD_10237 [Puccinia coronata f. sp. avenae]
MGAPLDGHWSSKFWWRGNRPAVDLYQDGCTYRPSVASRRRPGSVPEASNGWFQTRPDKLSMESDNSKATKPFVDWQLDRHTVWICSVSIGRFTLKVPVGRSMEASSGRFEIKAPVGRLMAASNGRYLTGAPTGRFMVASNGRSCQVAPTGRCHQASNGRFNLKAPTGRFHRASNGHFQGEAANGRSGSHRPTGASPRLRPADALEAHTKSDAGWSRVRCSLRPVSCPDYMLSSSQNYAHAETSSSSYQRANNRLLWRGAIINQAGSKLHGLAIVAHAINPKEFSNVRHDPFSANAVSRTLTDTCLELEMLRGRDLHVSRVTQLTLEPKERQENPKAGLQRGSRKSRVDSLLKGKDPESSGSDRGIPFSEIECDPDVRLYVDPRCSQTHTWILSQLGKRDLTPGGFTSDALVVTLDHTVDDRTPKQLVIFARCVEGASSQPSSSNTPLLLQLVIGQRKLPLTQRIPRPDDPMPRAVPAMLFGDLLKSGSEKKAGTVTSKSKSHPSLAEQHSSSDLVQPIFGKPPYPSTSTSGRISSSLTKSLKRNPKSVKKPANTPGRRAKQYLSSDDDDADDHDDRRLDKKFPLSGPPGKRKFQNLTSDTPKKMKINNKTPRDRDQLQDARAPITKTGIIHDEEDADMGNSFEAHRSPSPSPASFRCKTMTHIPTPETLDSPFESMSQPGHPSLAFLDVTNQRATSNPELKGPKGGYPKARDRTPPRDPPEAEQASKTKPDSSSHLAQNKLLIRKLTSESLNNRGLHKQSPKFKDLYGAVCRGVQFAMREAIEKGEIDKNLTRTFVESHLAMYMILNSENS